MIKSQPESDYILKYKIYCLIHNDQKEIAQLQYDLIKETGFKDNFFDKSFNILMGYTNNSETNISEKSFVKFPLVLFNCKRFFLRTKSKYKKIIWQYLSSNNLLTKVNDIDLEDREKIKSFEKATNEGNYKETDLLDLYTRFQFNIYQIISVFDAYKLLPNYEARGFVISSFFSFKRSRYSN